MRNFGNLGGSFNRSIRAVAGRRVYPSLLYRQQDVGNPYFYGAATYTLPNYDPNQPFSSGTATTTATGSLPGSNTTYFNTQGTNKQDVLVAGISGGAGVTSSFLTGLFDYKKAKLGMSGELLPASYDSSGGGSKTGLIIGLSLLGLVGLGAIAYMASK